MIEKALTYSGTLRDYIILTKPGIVALVLITTTAGIFIGNRGLPDSTLVLWILLGTGLAASGSTILNNFYDRDIDMLMKRTSSRAIPSGNIRPSTALASGISLIVLSFFILLYFVNALPALLTMTASFVYIVIYTHLMKRRSPNATIIGGISGALPPVIGYTAVSGTLSFEAIILFLIMFVWQPPHFWFLAIKYAEDYKKANIPTMPVSKGIFETKVKILMFNVVLLPVSLLPYFYGIAGKIYLITSFSLSLLYLLLTVSLLFSKGEKNVFRFFYYSIAYIAAIFIVMTADMVR